MTKILARDPARRCMKRAEWPEQDRMLWLAALAPGDALEPGGERAGYRPATNRKVEVGYGRWLAWLLYRGNPTDAVGPADRITRELVTQWLSDMEAVNGTGTRISRLEELYQAARVMGPGQDWSWLRRLAGRIRAKHRPVRDKRPRLVGADELFSLGLDLMTQPSGTPRQQAIQYRDGLAIALLAARPLRRTNLAGLRLDTSLIHMRGEWWILLAGEETKVGEPIEMPWPAALVPMLETWLAVHRPVLEAHRGRWHRPAKGALWLSADGSPMTGMALYDRIIAATKAAFGTTVNPHLFRDCAVTTIAIETPEQIGVASGVLGHRSRATTERYYNQARGIEAAQRMQATLQGLRDGTIRLPSEIEGEATG